jgi:hypothetical protein
VVGLPTQSTNYGYGVRVLPDVSLFAAGGPWQHAYVFCYSGLPVVLPAPPPNTTPYVPAFNATKGWDFATGIGSVNVYNLVTNW